MVLMDSKGWDLICPFFLAETVPKFGIAPTVSLSEQSWDRQKWFPLWEQEHRAVREGVALIDMSFMSKFLVCGRDAGTALNRSFSDHKGGMHCTVL